MEHDDLLDMVARPERVGVFVGRSARVGEPTRLQYQRKRVSGWWQAAARPYIAWWMGNERTTTVRGLRITVPVGVFPPKFFLSTKLLCRTLSTMNLHGHTMLEIGSGSGSVSLVAAQRGAVVTAVDLSDRACYATRRNAAANGLTVDVRESDLFAGLAEHLHPGSQVLMVLTEGGDGEIARIAEQHGYRLSVRRRSIEMLQYAYVFALER